MDQIVLKNYSLEWPKLFLKLGTIIRNELKDIAVRIDHIGSTSIPGIAAKPIIDIQISVRQLEPVALYKNGLEKCGYYFRENNPDLTKRYFRESPGEKRTPL